MTPLWLAALALLLLALSCLLVPLLAGDGNADAGEDERLRQLHALRLAEMERDLQAAALRPEDGAQALEDLQRLVLEDLQRGAPRRREARWLRWAPAGVLSVLLPVAAAVLYPQVGDPQAANHQLMAQREDLPHGDDEGAVAAMVTRLAQRLQEQPDDAEGWMMLARSYAVLERHEAAAAAYRKARALGEPATAQALAGHVLVAPALQGRVRSGDTLFIVARAASAGRMPVAALRMQLAELPSAFTLDDRHAMAPELALSRFPAASIEARISRSGSASRQPGDLFGTVPETALGRTDLRVVIDQVVR